MDGPGQHRLDDEARAIADRRLGQGREVPVSWDRHAADDRVAHHEDSRAVGPQHPEHLGQGPLHVAEVAPGLAGALLTGPLELGERGIEGGDAERPAGQGSPLRERHALGADVLAPECCVSLRRQPKERADPPEGELVAPGVLDGRDVGRGRDNGVDRLVWQRQGTRVVPDQVDADGTVERWAPDEVGHASNAAAEPVAEPGQDVGRVRAVDVVAAGVGDVQGVGDCARTLGDDDGGVDEEEEVPDGAVGDRGDGVAQHGEVLADPGGEPVVAAGEVGQGEVRERRKSVGIQLPSSPQRLQAGQEPLFEVGRGELDRRRIEGRGLHPGDKPGEGIDLGGEAVAAGEAALDHRGAGADHRVADRVAGLGELLDGPPD